MKKVDNATKFVWGCVLGTIIFYTIIISMAA